MYLYILLEIIYLIGIIINFFIKKYSELINIGPILISVIYILKNKHRIKNKKIFLLLSLFFSLCGDIFFILLNKKVIGVASFIVVQLCYFYFLKEKSNRVSIIILLNFIICCIVGRKIIIIEAIIYALLFLINIIFSLKRVMLKKLNPLFLVALISLLICDSCIAINYVISSTYKIKLVLKIIEWISYTINLILVTLLINDEKNKN